MAKRDRRRRQQRAEKNKTGPAIQARTRSRIDPINRKTAIGKSSRGLLAAPEWAASREVEKEQNKVQRRDRMDAVRHAVRARRLVALDDLKKAHSAATVPNQPGRPNAKRVSSYGSLTLTDAQQKHKQDRKPDEKRSPKEEKVRDLNNCKERPKSNKGNGGSRPFVPWCGRRK